MLTQEEFESRQAVLDKVERSPSRPAGGLDTWMSPVAGGLIPPSNMAGWLPTGNLAV
jgi:hypothetical protein